MREHWPKDSQGKFQGGQQGSSPLRSDGSRDSRAGRLSRMSSSQRCSNESRKLTLGCQGTYKKGKVSAQKRFNLLQ
jgi:hypothetical protein